MQERITDWRRKIEVQAEGRLRNLQRKKKKESGMRNYDR
jgi:hypothetical protein